MGLNEEDVTNWVVFHGFCTMGIEEGVVGLLVERKGWRYMGDQNCSAITTKCVFEESS
jgi:hypothetical protein